MNKSILLSLKLIAAKAEKLADDYENRKLWEGDLANGIAQLKEELSKLNVGRNDC